MSTKGERDPRVLAAYALAGIVWACFAWRFEFICDDAFISFRYSRNLALGNGLVYDTLREVPVEGYSNFLWVVWLSLFERLGVEITAAAKWSSMAASLTLLILTMSLAARRLSLGAGGLAATGLFLATLPAFGLWSTGGLATMPSALAIFGVLYAFHSDEDGPKLPLAIICAGTATLLRADGVGYLGLILIASYVSASSTPELRQKMRGTVLITAASVISIGLAHAIWRHGFYGEWVPNTAKVKAGLTTARVERGLLYVGSFVVALPSVLIAVGLGARRWREGPVALLFTLFTLIAGSFAYSVYIGGDFMPFGRFLAPALPAAALLFAWGWSRLAPKPAWALTCLCLLSSVSEAYDRGPAPATLRESLHFRSDREFQTEVTRWAEMKRNAAAWDLWGRGLALHTQPGESIILGGIGAIAYRAPELMIYDTYGLVTPEVSAHTAPLEGASPGHDVRVQDDFFLRPEILAELPSKPTYLGALVGLDMTVRWTERPEWLLTPFPGDAYIQRLAAKFIADYDVRLESEVIPLSANEGFPENSVLHLLRLHYD